jgi:non-heme chloroperoxidase
MIVHEVRGGGGVLLHAGEWGNPEGTPILFLHGWSQSHLCWARQVESSLAAEFRLVAVDLRGHGMSEKPLEPAAYTDPQLWADDVAAVVEQLGLERPVLVGWSYGGFVICDYVRAYGAEHVGGIDLAGGAVLLRPPTFDHIGPGFLENAADACAADLATSIAAIQRFLRRCSAEPLSPDEWSRALAWNMVVPSAVRGGLISREIDGDDVLSTLSVPLLLSHGRADEIVLPTMAEHVLEVCATATGSFYDGVGHMTFWEDAERFNRELAQLAAGVHATV